VHLLYTKWMVYTS